MAAVLFIVTIPTEAEEKRLKQEFITKISEIKGERAEQSSIEASTTNIDIANTKPSINISITSPPTTTTITNTLTIPDVTIPESSNSETIHASNADIPNVELLISGEADIANVQYGTFPKRRKSEPRQKSTDDYSVGIAKVLESTTSLKDMETSGEANIPATRKSWEGLRDILASTKRKSQKKKSATVELEITQNTCMQTVLKEILRKFQIQNTIWTKDSDCKMYQIFFTIEFNETYERLLDNFNEWGIGDREGSSITVMNCLASKTFSRKENNDDLNADDADNLAQKQGAWERFMNSVRSRLNVAQIVRDVRQDAAVTFDFVVLLVAAAILASFGLVEDSTIFLASSMLISPLMGPIIAAIFGTVIKDRSLGKLGLKNELFGIFTAIFVGFVFGMIVCAIDERYGIGEGLTKEMLSRCELHSLIVGLFTAVASGAAAAIGILGGNIGSLVGVAISASLLPPAVNSGLLWSFAVIYKIYEKDESRFSNVVPSSMYSKNQATELAILGSISTCLTICNVICVYLMGILVLKIKEIAPVISRNNREFWKHDIKIARDLNRAGFDTDTAIIDEYANLPKEDQKALGLSTSDFLRTIRMDEASYQNTWSPLGARHPYDTHHEPMKENYTTIHRIERLYSTITHQHHPSKEKRHRFGLGRKPAGRLADLNTSYKILSETRPCFSSGSSKITNIPSVNIVTPNATLTACSTVTSDSMTPTMNDDRKRRKFIVTPAEEDPLQTTYPSDDIDL
uniref:DUF389 domain-containing protein n=1 Tax=Glossina brevipalpis TaxID=37001 RepID=A0A1A9WZQ5_9MUSC